MDLEESIWVYLPLLIALIEILHSGHLVRQMKNLTSKLGFSLISIASATKVIILCLRSWTIFSTATEDELYIYDVTTSDADGDDMTITAPVPPNWLTTNL